MSAAPEGPAPPGAHLLRPGDSYYGIPYEMWAAWEGGTADILHLQFAAERARAVTPVPAAARLGGEGWQAEPEIGASPLPESEYGFATGARLVACSRERLVAQCVMVPETPRVWTPAAHELVRPEEVPFLVEALGERRRQSAEQSLLFALVALLAGVALAWTARAGARSGWTIFAALAAAWLAASLLEHRRARRLGPEAFAAAREEFRHAVWIGTQRATHTEALLGVLIAVAIAESFGWSEAIAAAGLVKEAVREGEVWRLATAPLLHGGMLHLAMNALALWSLGPLVEAHSPRAFLPLLFLVSALLGGLFSLELLPETTSVGASGGILGLAGYLFVLGYRRRHGLPAGFIQRMGVGILATAVFGLVGYAWVDNATHLGGLLGGVLLALVFGSAAVGKGRTLDRYGSLAGRVALVVLLAGAAASVWAIYLTLSGGP